MRWQIHDQLLASIHSRTLKILSPHRLFELVIPRLQARTHNLSFSGMQYDWNIKVCLERKLPTLANHTWQTLKIPE